MSAIAPAGTYKDDDDSIEDARVFSLNSMVPSSAFDLSHSHQQFATKTRRAAGVRPVTAVAPNDAARIIPRDRPAVQHWPAAAAPARIDTARRRACLP